ncbi:MAG: phosphate ABC transporter substrate-binding protein [Candidatus Omnitrophica bacterium]|nr:phosphate ABC transporter substrate-binding protein [Candidatus Omnitrophota bacterium]
MQRLQPVNRWAAAVMGLCLVASPASADDLSGSLQIKGSDTMVNLCQAWAESFMAQHPQVTIAVTGGGSGTGIAALIGGTCEVAATSRQMTDKERTQARAKGHAPREWIVGRDGLAVAVHPKNPVQQLTVQQLADVFSGAITTWDAVGGPRKAVVLLSREVNSGTHVYFKEHVLAGNEFAPAALLMPSSQAIADEVTTNPDAIGYYGMGYLNLKNAMVAVAKTAAGPYVTPSGDSVRSGTYPIARPLFLYSAGELQGVAKAFLDFVLSPAGQRIVQDTDFVPVR